MSEIVTLADASSLAERAAELMRAAITAAIQERGVAMIALSGGSTPGPAYRLLARSALDFARCRWFFVDERCVPPDSTRSNYRSAVHDLFEPAGVDLNTVFRMQGELDAESAAAAYAQILRRELGDSPRLDLIVAGMGDDGHTASLFPGTGAVLRADPLTTAVDPGGGLERRVTLTRSVLIQARRVLVLAQGEGKRGALARALGPGPEDDVPSRLYQAAPEGVVIWLVDRAARGAAA